MIYLKESSLWCPVLIPSLPPCLNPVYCRAGGKRFLLSFVTLGCLVSVNNSAALHSLDKPCITPASSLSTSPSATTDPDTGWERCGGTRWSTPTEAGRKCEQNIVGTNYIVERIYTLLRHLYFILYCRNGETCCVFASVIGEEQMVEAQLEVIRPLK